MLWVPLIVLMVAAIFDLRRREIPDWISAGLLAWAIASIVLGWSATGWLSLAGGLASGLAIGLFLFWLGGFGGGDAKVLAALGAILGPGRFGSLLFYVAITGAVLALVALVRGKREIAYAPAIAIGFAVLIIAQGVW